MKFVPVLDRNNEPLMPCHPARARKLVRSGKAKERWLKNIYHIQLIDRSKEDSNIQHITIGVDPGSKFEGFTVASQKHIYLNINYDYENRGFGKSSVKTRLETRRSLRRGRRYRNTPYRKCRFNRSILTKSNRVPPSTKSRWDAKLNVINLLNKLYPVNCVCVEDIKARTRKGRCGKWNRSFSPLEVGKRSFYSSIKNLGFRLITVGGMITKKLRDDRSLTKMKDKTSKKFDAHCVDSFVLSTVGNNGGRLDNKDVLIIKPYITNKRSLHKANFSKGHERSKVGVRNSISGIPNGSIVRHKSSGRGKSYGYCIVGGGKKGKISIYKFDEKIKYQMLNDGKKEFRHSVNKKDLELITYNSFFSYYYSYKEQI